MTSMSTGKQPFYKQKIFLIIAAILFTIVTIGGVLWYRTSLADSKVEMASCYFVKDHKTSVPVNTADSFTVADWLYLMNFNAQKEKKSDLKFDLAYVKDVTKMKALLPSAEAQKSLTVKGFYLEALCRIAEKETDVAKVLDAIVGDSSIKFLTKNPASAPVCLLKKYKDQFSTKDFSIGLKESLKNPCISDKELVALKASDKFSNLDGGLNEILVAAVDSGRNEFAKHLAVRMKDKTQFLSSKFVTLIINLFKHLTTVIQSKDKDGVDEQKGSGALKGMFGNLASVLPDQIDAACSSILADPARKVIYNAQILKSCAKFQRNVDFNK